MHMTMDGKKLVLGTLIPEKIPQQLFDLVFDKDFKVSHNSKNSSIYLYGYKADNPADDNEYPFLNQSFFSNLKSFVLIMLRFCVDSFTNFSFVFCDH